MIARMERLVNEIRDSRKHHLQIDADYSQKMEECLQCLPRMGAPDDLLLAIPDEQIAVAEALITEASRQFAKHDHRHRVVPKLRRNMSQHNQILLVGPADQAASVIREASEGQPPENVTKIVKVDASGLSHDRQEGYELFLRVAHMLGVPGEIKLDDYKGFRYLQVMWAINAEFPNPPVFASYSDYPATYVVIQNCDPRLAGFICCNLRDEMWQLPLRWIWTIDDENASWILSRPSDFFNRQIDIATGFDHFPNYNR
jgi:hypothetical protein